MEASALRTASLRRLLLYHQSEQRQAEETGNVCVCGFPPVCMHVSPPMLCCFLFTVPTGTLTDTHTCVRAQFCLLLPAPTPSPDSSLWLFLSSLVSAARSLQPHLQTNVKTVTNTNVMYVTGVRPPGGLLTYRICPQRRCSRGGQIFALLLLCWAQERAIKEPKGITARVDFPSCFAAWLRFCPAEAHLPCRADAPTSVFVIISHKRGRRHFFVATSAKLSVVSPPPFFLCSCFSLPLFNAKHMMFQRWQTS